MIREATLEEIQSSMFNEENWFPSSRVKGTELFPLAKGGLLYRYGERIVYCGTQDFDAVRTDNELRKVLHVGE